MIIKKCRIGCQRGREHKEFREREGNNRHDCVGQELGEEEEPMLPCLEYNMFARLEFEFFHMMRVPESA